jgi:hypothetical protein
LRCTPISDTLAPATPAACWVRRHFRSPAYLRCTVARSSAGADGAARLEDAVVAAMDVVPDVAAKDEVDVKAVADPDAEVDITGIVLNTVVVSDDEDTGTEVVAPTPALEMEATVCVRDLSVGMNGAEVATSEVDADVVGAGVWCSPGPLPLTDVLVSAAGWETSFVS